MRANKRKKARPPRFSAAQICFHKQMTDQVATVIVTAVGIHTGTRPPLVQIDGIVPDAPSTVKKKTVKRQKETKRLLHLLLYSYTIRSARDLLLPGSNRGPAERKGVIKMGDQRKYIAMIVLQSILYGAMDVISKLVYPSIRPMAQRCRSQTDRPSAF